MKKTHVLSFHVIACLFVFSVSLVAQDTIHLKNKGPQNGIVRAETLEHVKWSRVKDGNVVATTETPWSDVQKIEYGDLPETYEKAVSKKGSNPKKAIELLSDFIENGNPERDLFLQKAYYLRGDLLYRSAGSDEEQLKNAVEAYKKAMRSYPRTRGYKRAVKNLISIYLQLGQKKTALEWIDKVQEKGLGERINTLMSYMKGMIYKRDGDCDQAVEFFKKAEDAPEKTIANKATLEIGNCYLESGELSRARSQFKSILTGGAKGLSELALAGAHNGLGRIMFENDYQENAEDKSVRKKNVQVLKDAILHFLRGVTLYKPDEGGDTKETERSLYWAAKAFDALSRNASKAKQRSRYKNEAIKVLNTLLQQYPRSSFQAKAKDLRQKIQS